MLLEPAAKVPVSRGNSSPRSPSTDSDIVLFVYVLQKLYVDSLVPLLCISKVSKILNEKNVIIIIIKKNNNIDLIISITGLNCGWNHFPHILHYVT